MAKQPKDDKMFSFMQVMTICTTVGAIALSYAGLSTKMEMVQKRVEDHESRLGMVEQNQYAEYAGKQPAPKQFNQINEAIIPNGIQFNRKRR